MTKFLLPLVALGVVASPAFAQETDKPLTFTRDGVQYTATVKTIGQTTVIDGRDSSGKAFTLRVRNGAFAGTYGATPVSYTVSR